MHSGLIMWVTFFGAQLINQLVPQHPYLNDVPLIDELRHQNTHHVIPLTLDVAKKYSAQ